MQIMVTSDNCNIMMTDLSNSSLSEDEDQIFVNFCNFTKVQIVEGMGHVVMTEGRQIL